MSLVNAYPPIETFIADPVLSYFALILGIAIMAFAIFGKYISEGQYTYAMIGTGIMVGTSSTMLALLINDPNNAMYQLLVGPMGAISAVLLFSGLFSMVFAVQGEK